MKIDGKLIATEIKTDLKEKIIFLKSKNVIPNLAVILVGNDQSSQVYVRQKEKVGSEIGATAAIYRFEISESDKDTSAREHPRGVPQAQHHPWSGGITNGREIKKELISLVNKLSHDNSVHGIIIQRPVPLDISKEELDRLVTPQKDVDGFHPKSPFTPPIASAVLKILEWVHKNSKDTSAREHPRGVPQAQHHPWSGGIDEVKEFSKDFINWLKKQNILVIGRGETAGRPIADTIKKMKIPVKIAHSKTNNLKELCLVSDVIITCVGIPNIVRHYMVTKKTILLGVGLHPENNKLQTDYNQEEIAPKVAFYTPVPGGVGPVNVACLMENLVISCETYGGSL